MKYLLTAFFWSICGTVFAAPSLELLDSCATGQSVGTIRIVEIPFLEINEMDDYAQGYTANYVTYKGKEIGAARKGDAQAVAFAGKVYVTADATLINIAKNEFAELIKHSGADLYQPADWYFAKDRDNHSYVCAALNRSMERATPVVFALSTFGNPRPLFFYVGHTS